MKSQKTTSHPVKMKNFQIYTQTVHNISCVLSVSSCLPRMQRGTEYGSCPNGDTDEGSAMLATVTLAKSKWVPSLPNGGLELA